MSRVFRQAVADLDRRLDAGERLTESDVWSLLAFCKTELVRLQISRLLGRVRAVRSSIEAEHPWRQTTPSPRTSNGSRDSHSLARRYAE
jgi:hypothetical protein